MLKLFRKKIVMKIILWGLVIIIVPAFVLWGGASSSRSKDKGPGYVGFVHNRKVSFDELSNALSGVRSQIILNYFNQPKVLDALLSNKPILAKLAWDRILMMEEVKKAGIRVSDKEVVEALRSHPLFIRNGVFDDRFYAYMLKNNIGLEPRAFEEIVRENLALQRLSVSFSKDIKLSDADILDEYKKEFGKIKISYILFEPKDYLEKISIGENAAKDFYDKNKNELMVKSNLKGAIPDRPATFEESKADIEKLLKEIEARKMLKDKLSETHKELVERTVNKGETFAAAASKLGLNIKDTDFFSRKDTVEAVGDTPMIVEASYGLKDLELSKPLEINKGYIIFEVAGRKAADEETFAKEKEEYSKKVREARSNQIMEKWLKGLEDKAKLAIKLEEAEKHYQN
ncbi:MAG: SurA N-terminal domain-containing protein [Candidatus Omnitrophica bacterium]|nr:SurA N-terminal domain-containing protein [Candidatus Omnitrophota bacterium]